VFGAASTLATEEAVEINVDGERHGQLEGAVAIRRGGRIQSGRAVMAPR
jgi:hypothetical protein